MGQDEFSVNQSFSRDGKVFVHWSNVRVGDATHQAIKILKRRKRWRNSIIIHSNAHSFRLGFIRGYRGVFVEQGKEEGLSKAVDGINRSGG
jgi:hypothetical protein